MSRAEAAAPERPVPEPSRLGAGWRTVAAKELADHLLSIRFLILLVLLALTAVGSTYAASGRISEAAADVSGSPALFLRLFTVAPESGERVPPFLTLIGFLGPLLGIAFGFDAVSGERAQGTLPRLVAQPIHRDDVINGKFAAGLAVIAMTLLSLTLLIAGIGLLRLGIVPTVEEVWRILLWLVLTVVYVGFWLALATLCSVAMRRAATSALAAIASWLVLTLFIGLLVSLLADVVSPGDQQAPLDEQLRNVRVEQQLGRISPAVLYEEATAALLTPEIRSVGVVLPTQFLQIESALPNPLSVGQSLLIAWPQAVALVALTVALFAGAYVLFMRQEIRA